MASEQQGPPSTAQNHPDYRVVGIGASAGGLAAYTALLRALPERPGVALLLVQHLDPNQHSMLPEILSRESKLPVEEASQGTLIEVDHVYVMPADASMRIEDGRISLSKRDNPSERFLPVDTLFRSLAEDRGELAVGIVLSGTGSDGVLGLTAIREAGGLTYAEETAEAEYDGMPKAAIDAGVVDAALSISRLATELVRLGRHAPVMGQRAPGLVDENAYAEILTLVHKATGLELTDYRKTTLLRRISRRMLLGGATTLAEYLEKLREDPAEVKALYGDVLVNVTRFFRDPGALDALKQEVFPAILQRRQGAGPIRIWVPGCSKGQEPYSILMTLTEYLEEAGASAEIQMFASDVNERDVAFARAGVYPHGIVSEVSEERLTRFFEQVPGGYQIKRSIREMCVFATHDITRDPPFSKIDLVSLRNVLIYMERRLQHRVLNILHYAIEPGGFLLLGSSESADADSTLFAPTDKKNRVYRRKPGAARLSAALAPSAGRTQLSGQRNAAPQGFDVFAEADRLVRGQYQLPGLLLSADSEVLQFRGNVGPFLAPAQGTPDFRLTKLVSPGLASGVEAAVRAAADTRMPARRRGRVLGRENDKLEVEIEAVPISSPEGDGYFLVFFRPEPTTPADRPGTEGSEDGADEASSLRDELDQTREQLETVLSERESANADLRAVNEKFQASNEELRTINEEFQTAQEELQSTNEELTTLNDELRARNTELISLADDLRNVIDGVEIPIIILGSDLCIRRFTPQASAVVNIMPADVGRPVTDLNLKVEFAELRSQALGVISSGQPSETEVRDLAGRWLSMRIRPYLTHSGEIDGVVVAFIDIDELKRSNEEARAAREHAEAVVETVRHPLVTTTIDLVVIEANSAFYEDFGVKPEETVGRPLYDLDDGYWDSHELREQLQRVASGEAIDPIEVDGILGSSGRRITRITARRIRESTDVQAVLLSMEDTTAAVRRQTLTSALNDISLTLASSMEFDSVFERVLAQSSAALNANSAALLLKRDTQWVMSGGYGLPQSVVGATLTDEDLSVAVEALKTGEPVLLPDTSDRKRFSTSLGLDPQYRAALLVPIIFRDSIIGSMSFHFVSPQVPFTQAEDDFGRRLGTMLAFAIENAELFSEQRDIAHTLQGALVTAPGNVAGITFGYLYRSATKTASVGGDFFDLFELDRGRVGILIGDVSGKGVRAATLTALTKNTIRALAYENDSPAVVIKKTNDVIFKATPVSTFVTLLLCILDTSSGAITYCSAGHTTGLIRKTDGEVVVFDSHSPLAGAFDGIDFEDGHAQMSEGDSLVLYTDGITEAHRGNELFGEARVINLLRAQSVVDPKTVPQIVLDAVLEYTDGKLSDDVAIVAVALARED